MPRELDVPSFPPPSDGGGCNLVLTGELFRGLVPGILSKLLFEPAFLFVTQALRNPGSPRPLRVDITLSPLLLSDGVNRTIIPRVLAAVGTGKEPLVLDRSCTEKTAPPENSEHVLFALVPTFDLATRRVESQPDSLALHCRKTAVRQFDAPEIPGPQWPAQLGGELACVVK